MATLADLARAVGLGGGFTGLGKKQGVGTGMQAGGPGGYNMNLPGGGAGAPYTGGLQPGLGAGGSTAESPVSGYTPPGTGGIKPAPGQYVVGGAPGQPFLSMQTPTFVKPGTQEWFNSPQGMAQQWKAGVSNSPWAPLMPHGGQYQGRQRGFPTPEERMASYDDGSGRMAAASARMSDPNTPKNWVQQELAAKGLPWQGMTENAQMQAYLNSLPPEQKAAYLAKYKAAGLDPFYPTQAGPAGGLSGF